MSQDKPRSPLLTPEEARTHPDYFAGKISKNPFYESIRRGELPTLRVGRKIFLIRARLDAMMRGEAA